MKNKKNVFSISSEASRSFLLYLLLLILFFSFGKQAYHSEGTLMISEWGEPILGIDFENKRFLYVEDGKRKIWNWEFVSIIKRDFFPYLTLEIKNKEFTILWKEYHTPIFTEVARKIVRKIIKSEKIATEMTLWTLLIFYFIAIFLFLKDMLKKTFKNPPVVFAFLFILTTPSSFILLLSFHHMQGTLFLLLLIYFLEKRRYILSFLCAGLTIYSYLPTVYGIIGVILFYILKRKGERKKIILVGVASLLFSIPSLIYIITSKEEDYKKVYRCSDCLVLFPPKYLKSHLGRAGSESMKDLIPVILGETLGFLFPSKLKDSFEFAIKNVKEAFSFSDIARRYGLISSPTPLKKLSDIAIWIHIILILFGVLYVRKPYEFWIIFISVTLYTILGKIFVLIPKMLYFFLPIYSVFATRVFFSFLEKDKKLAVVFLLSGILRIVDIIGVGSKYPPYIRWEENKEVAEFVQKHKLDVIQYSLPIAFKFFTDGKINPPFLALIFESTTPEERQKIAGFLAEITHKENKYVIIDPRFENDIKNGAEKSGYGMIPIFRNDGFEIVKFEKMEDIENY